MDDSDNENCSYTCTCTSMRTIMVGSYYIYNRQSSTTIHGTVLYIIVQSYVRGSSTGEFGRASLRLDLQQEPRQRDVQSKRLHREKNRRPQARWIPDDVGSEAINNELVGIVLGRRE